MSTRNAEKAKSKSERKKLSLSKETLKDLNSERGAAKVKGGGRVSWGPACRP